MLGMQDDISEKELTQRWRIYWIQCIFEFSNTKFQEMAWIQGAQANWPDDEDLSSSFEACHSSYFDNLDLYGGYTKAVQSGKVAQKEADEANTFHALAAFYDEPAEDPKDILKDPEWIEVVESAKMFWDYLKATVTSKREIDLMKQLDQKFS
jgi:hypothetical protein